MSAYFLDQLFSLKDIPVVTDIRGYGMLGGIDVAPMGRPGKRGHLLQKRLFEEGVHIKTTGDAGSSPRPSSWRRARSTRMCDTFRRVLSAI